MSYVSNNLIDTKSRVILATKVSQPGITTEIDAAQNMLDSLIETDLSKNIQTLVADKGYGSTAFITDHVDRGIRPLIPLLANDKYEAEPAWNTKTYNHDQHMKRLQKTKEVKAKNYAVDFAKTKEYKLSQKLRKRVEHIFAEAKVCHGLGRARCRGFQAMQHQAYMTDVVQNIKRLTGFMQRKFKNVSVAALKKNILWLIQPQNVCVSLFTNISFKNI
ncbi:transposase [Candidatus Latescibacterota bacterium]